MYPAEEMAGIATPTDSSVIPIADMAVKHGKIHGQRIMIRH